MRNTKFLDRGVAYTQLPPKSQAQEEEEEEKLF
jgi:hypothetical protein